jgi:hypothetical protein
MGRQPASLGTGVALLEGSTCGSSIGLAFDPLPANPLISQVE